MASTLAIKKFKDVNLSDTFFDSLKADYPEFEHWFSAKADQECYVSFDEASGELRGFVYLKEETEALGDIKPSRPLARRLKVGTLKIDAHGTKLGERVIKKVFDHAIESDVEEIYVTVFPKHGPLIELFKRYGFEEEGEKISKTGVEKVLVRRLSKFNEDLRKRYPFVLTENIRLWMLAVYPEYHTRLFPDSILKNEVPSIVKDVSHANTIHKVYIGRLPLTRMSAGDAVVIYRTTDRPGQARFRSVATTVCVVEEVRRRRDFATIADFLAYVAPHSVFSEAELRNWFNNEPRMYVVKMMYNIAFNKRPIRGVLLDDVNIPEQPRWDLKPLSLEQFSRIVELGEVNESLIVN